MSSRDNTKVCLLGATLGTKNMGVSALTAGAIKCFVRQFPGAEIRLLDYGREPASWNVIVDGKSVPVHLLNMRFSKKLYLRNHILVLILLALLFRVIPSRRLRQFIISKNEYLRHIAESDVVASIAGGDSFSDIYGLGRFFYVSLPQLLVLFMGKELVLLPQTHGPFRTRISRLVARYILRRSSVIYSRDYEGLGELRDIMGLQSPNGKLRFCYDVAFVLDPVKPDTVGLEGVSADGGGAMVGLNISGLLFMGGYTRDNMFGLKVDYRKLIYDLIEHLVRQKKVDVLLVPHVFGAHSESDSAVCEKLYAELKPRYKDALHLVRGSYDQSGIKYIIGLCDFFIGSRMHACIAALSQGIPAVAIAYSRKFSGVMETIGAESLVADPRRMDEAEILSVIDGAYEQRGELGKRLRQKMPEVREAVLGLLRGVGAPA